MTCHKQGHLLTFFECEDTTLLRDSPMTALSTYGTLWLAAPALALLSAWLALRADDAWWRSGHQSSRARGRSTYDPAVSYVLRSRVRPRLNASDVDEHEPRELIGTGETYELALEQLHDQVPEGWVLLGIDRYLEA